MKNFEQKKELTISHGLREIDKDAYHVTMEHLIGQMQEIYEELNTVPVKISNAEKLLENSLKKLQNLSVLWDYSDLENKRRIQKIVFPEGIFYDTKNREYLTRKINGFVLVTFYLSQEYALNKNGNSQFFHENSRIVARMGIEPITSGL